MDLFNLKTRETAMTYRKWTIPAVTAVMILCLGTTAFAHHDSCCKSEIVELDQWFDNVEITVYIPDAYPEIFAYYSLIRFEEDEGDGVYLFRDRRFQEWEMREGEWGYHYFDAWDDHVSPGRVTYVLESDCGTCDAESIDVDAFSMGCGAVSAGGIDSLIPVLILIVLLILSLGSWKK